MTDHQKLFRRVELDFGSVAGANELTTAEWLERFGKGESDPGRRGSDGRLRRDLAVLP